MARARKPKAKSAHPGARAGKRPTPLSQLPPSARRLAERIRILMDRPWAWYYLVMGWEAEAEREGFGWPDVMKPTSELLEQDWDKAKKYVQEWIEAHAQDVADLFRYPESYPDSVVFLGLCTLKFGPGQAETIQKFLTSRIFKGVAWEGSKVFRKHLGYVDEGDFSPTLNPDLTQTSRDIDRELYLHFVEAVLHDVHRVTTNVLGWLRVAARNYIYDLHDKTQTDMRPGLELVASPVGEEDSSSTGEEELSALALRASDRRRRRRAPDDSSSEEDEKEADRIAEAAEMTTGAEEEADQQKLEQHETRPGRIRYRQHDYRVQEAAVAPAELVELVDLLNRARLTPRQRELATLLAQGYQPADCATEMGVTPQAINGMLRRIGAKLSPPPQG